MANKKYQLNNKQHRLVDQGQNNQDEKYQAIKSITNVFVGNATENVYFVILWSNSVPHITSLARLEARCLAFGLGLQSEYHLLKVRRLSVLRQKCAYDKQAT